MKWNPVSDRIISARFFSKFAKLTVIQIYSPTNEAEEDDKDSFYEQLQKELDTVPNHDMVIVIGDANAKVGDSNQGWEKVMGREGIGTMNENGCRLAEFCALNNLVIGGTLFKHPNVHKYTWESPNGRDKNQIDHVVINGRYRRSLLDVRVMRGADANSDHHLVCAKLRLKLCRDTNQRRSQRKAYNMARLKDLQTRKTFQLELRNRFQQLPIQESTVDQQWENMRDIYNESAEKVLGIKRREHKDWISMETYRAMDERRMIKEEIGRTNSERLKEMKREQYRGKDREVKSKARADKRKYLDDIADKAEEAAKKNQLSELYTLTRQLSNQKKSRGSGIRSKDGDLLTKEDQVLERWKEHFEEVLNIRSENIDIPEGCNIGENPDIETIDTSQITIDEVKRAIMKLKNGKSPGIDNINPELLKESLATSTSELQKLFNRVLEEREVPSDWKRSLIVKIPKKGDLTLCDNYRGISLLSVPSKVFCRVIIDRLREGVEETLREEQAAFRKGRGTADQIYILRNILEQSIEWQAPLYINFIDFRKAFDSVIRNKLWDILRHYGIPEIYVTIITKIYEGSTSCVLEAGKSSEWFEVKTGVKQGCVMSGFIFNIVIDWIMRNTNNSNRGIRWKFTTCLEDLDYADDLSLLSSRFVDIQEKSTRLYEVARFTGLKINTTKTKTMRVNCRNNNAVVIGNNEVEDVDSFIYLGATLDKFGGTEADIKRRLSLARAAFASLHKIWKSPKYSTRTKLRIFNTNVIAVLLYSSEMWRTTVADEGKLDTFQRKCLRKILKIHWPEKISNVQLYERAKATPLSLIIKLRRWKWIGHVLRREARDNIKIALTWAPEGRRKRGRPRNTWRRTVEKEREELGWESWRTAENEARDRQG